MRVLMIIMYTLILLFSLYQIFFFSGKKYIFIGAVVIASFRLIILLLQKK